MKMFRIAALATAALVGAAFVMPLTVVSADAATKKTVHHVTSSPEVKNAQAALNKMGSNLTVDGKMGKKTVAAVKSFQKGHSLDATGTLDAKTKSALGIA